MIFLKRDKTKKKQIRSKHIGYLPNCITIPCGNVFRK